MSKIDFYRQFDESMIQWSCCPRPDPTSGTLALNPLITQAAFFLYTLRLLTFAFELILFGPAFHVPG